MSSVIGAAFFGSLVAFESGNATADEPPRPGVPTNPADDGSFGLNKVWIIDITIPSDEYQAMQPPPMAFPGAPPPPQVAKPRKPREAERNLFGMEFPWAHGALTVQGTTYQDVAIRYAGNASYMASAAGLKRPFKVDFDRYAHREFHALKGVQLQAGALDPSKAREALALGLFRAAGIPAPRTAFADVTLTVPGRHDRAFLGLYTVVEPVDQKFIEARFRTSNGLLLKPERMRGIDDLGDDWEKYKAQYQPQWTAPPEQGKRVVEFARLIHRADENQFRAEIANYLDIDQFLRFMAINALLANADNFFTLGYNYALYLHPDTKKFIFIPGEQEMAFANFLMMGTADQLMDMSLAHPYTGEHKLVDRLLAIKDVGEKYQQLLKELSASTFTKERLVRDAAVITEATKAVAAREAKAAPGPGGAGGGPPPAARRVRRASRSPHVRREALGLDRTSTCRQGGWILAEVQLRTAAGRSSESRTDYRQKRSRRGESAQRVSGHALRRASESGVPCCHRSGRGWRGLRRGRRAGFARTHRRGRQAAPLRRR
jgi:hypothetical protein